MNMDNPIHLNDNGRLQAEIRASDRFPPAVIEYWLSWMLSYNLRIATAKEALDFIENIENEMGDNFPYMIPEKWMYADYYDEKET